MSPPRTGDAPRRSLKGEGGAWTVSIRSPLGANRIHTVGRFMMLSREKIVFRVTMRPAVSTMSARENVAEEIPLAPDGVVNCGRMSPVAL